MSKGKIDLKNWNDWFSHILLLMLIISIIGFIIILSGHPLFGNIII